MFAVPGGSNVHLTLDALHVLDAIDRHGSFAAAAEALSRVPSAVSYTVQKLEQDLGVVLFDRSGYRAKLTPAGAQLVKDGRDLLRTVAQIEKKVREISAGGESQLAIVVGSLVPLGSVYSLLRAFYDVPTHDSTRVRITTDAHAASLKTLLNGRADILIGVPEQKQNIDGIRSRVLGEVELALVMLKTHPLARAPGPLSSQMLGSYRHVKVSSDDFPEYGDLDTATVIVVDDYASQAEAIRQGLGIGYVPLHLIPDDLESGRLVSKLVPDAPRLRLTFAWRQSGLGKGVQWILDQLGNETIRECLMPRGTVTRTTNGLSDSPVGKPRINHVPQYDDWGPQERRA
jgi:DNA-binding transcriptional LysR family regulator